MKCPKCHRGDIKFNSYNNVGPWGEYDGTTYTVRCDTCNFLLSGWDKEAMEALGFKNETW